MERTGWAGLVLLVALALAGCGTAAPSIAIAKDLNDNTNCAADTTLVGVLTERLDLRKDDGSTRALIWPSSFTIRWSAGIMAGQWVVRDGAGDVVAESGNRYRMDGTEFVAAGNAFWVCGRVTHL
jgi:hypothetical protein